MSKRAEKAARKIFRPIDKGLFSKQELIDFQNLRMEQKKQYIAGYEQGEKDTIERAIKWLIDRIDIPCSVATNENGKPLADSYIDYAKKRLEAANKIVDEFRKAMGEES